MLRGAARSARKYNSTRGALFGGALPVGSTRRARTMGVRGTAGRRARVGGAIGVGGMLGANAVVGPRGSTSGRNGLAGRTSGGRGY